MPKIAVIDANIIVSALFGGTPKKSYLKALQSCDIYISSLVEQELVGLLKYLKPKLGPKKIKKLNAIILNLLLMAKKVDPKSEVNICRDKKDNKYLSLCLEAKADFLITGDKDLLDITKKELASANLKRLRILTPADFINL